MAFPCGQHELIHEESVFTETLAIFVALDQQN